VGRKVLYMSYARCIVATKSNVAIAEISPDIEYISWRLNKVGRAKFTLAKTDSKATERILRFGNRILFEFDNGLPNWVGVIEPPRNWDGKNVRCMAFSAEHIFSFRTTDKGRYFSGQTVGAIYKKLITEANDVSSMGITVGDVYEGGGVHSPSYHFKSLLDIFQDSLTKNLSDYDFDVTGTYRRGNFIFKANLYETKGTTKRGIALVEGANVTELKLSEQGPIVNSWDVIGEGFGWGDSRPTAHSEDDASIDKYGLREDSRVYPSVKLITTLQYHANAELDDTKLPYNEYDIDVMDLAPGTFANYDIGDFVTLQSASIGFDGINTLVRILDREYQPEKNICYLLVKE
jgi:hypothetical protein